MAFDFFDYWIPQKKGQNFQNWEKTRKGFLEKKKTHMSLHSPPPPTLPELSFLLATRRLVLLYISIKYHQNIMKGIQVTELTRN